jgi:hypothetical protein
VTANRKPNSTTKITGLPPLVHVGEDAGDVPAGRYSLHR